MWQVRGRKPLVREENPLKYSSPCGTESPADVFGTEGVPFPGALAEEYSGISLGAWVRHRGCQKAVPSPALCYMCPQQHSTWADIISAPTEALELLWTALCGSAAPRFHLCYLCEVWLSTVLQMILLIARPANSNESMVKVYFVVMWQIKLIFNNLTDETLANGCPSLLVLCHTDRHIYKKT